MGHFIEVCKSCGDVISQCRCPDPNKEKRYGVCAKCAAQQGVQLTGLCACQIFIPSAHSTALVCRNCGKPPRR